jgi:hypothetical protein
VAVFPSGTCIVEVDTIVAHVVLDAGQEHGQNKSVSVVKIAQDNDGREEATAQLDHF